MAEPAPDSRPLDPVSHALGQLAGRFEGMDKRLDSLERYVLWGFGITWTLILGVGLVTRWHG